MKKIDDLREEIINKLKASLTEEDIERIRVDYLSKKGEFTKLMGEMKTLSNEEKPAFGKSPTGTSTGLDIAQHYPKYKVT